jgi:selenide,water dikinase
MHSLFLKDLILLGGGHAHLDVLKRFGMRPLGGLRLTLVARELEAPYSGMLPGLIAGRYDRDEAHVDLLRVARFAGARLVHAEAAGLDLDARAVHFADRPPLRFDLLSLNIGSSPRLDVPGAAGRVIPVKPVDTFLAQWLEIVARAERRGSALRLAVVGGGVAGAELALAGAQRLGRSCAITLVSAGELAPRQNPRARRLLARALAERGVAVETGAEVASVRDGALALVDGREIPFDEAIWATQAGPAAWLGETGLALDAAGFVAVGASLRSVSHDFVFAAGDTAGVLPFPREKAGVVAVRQGPVLAENLRRAALGRKLKPFRPQSRILALIGTGGGAAIAARGRFAFRGALAWRLKEQIDRRWMRSYQELPAMAAPRMPRERIPDAHGREEPGMRCGGCGAKLPAESLMRVLHRLDMHAGEDASAAREPLDDAAILVPPRDVLLLQTSDFFRAFIGDPYLFGRIAAAHALSDIFAMGGRPWTALAIVGLPPDAPPLMEDDLFQMLSGGLAALTPAGARLVGGHSAEAAEPGLGFAITGTVHPDRILRKGGLRPGDRLILTKPLGTGALFAAEMRGQARARWIEAALASMVQSSAEAAAELLAHGASACTDVTGFGLAGHLLEMLDASDVDARIETRSVPALDGALTLLEAGISSTLHPGNARAGARLDAGATAADAPETRLLFDPQTSGGLLAGIAAERADACVAALRRAGFGHAAVIGAVTARTGLRPRIRLGR